MAHAVAGRDAIGPAACVRCAKSGGSVLTVDANRILLGLQRLGLRFARLKVWSTSTSLCTRNTNGSEFWVLLIQIDTSVIKVGSPANAVQPHGDVLERYTTLDGPHICSNS